MSGPEPSARATADPRTVRLALELLERTAGRRRRCRRCRSVIAENARKRGQAWSVCTPCEETRHEHLSLLRRIYGYKTFSGHGARALKSWLAGQAEQARSNEDLARRFVDQCRRSQTIVPAISTIERLCADALVECVDLVYLDPPFNSKANYPPSTGRTPRTASGWIQNTSHAPRGEDNYAVKPRWQRGPKQGRRLRGGGCVMTHDGYHFSREK